MKLTRIEQNIADVKHSLEGWEKYSSGGEIAKKQLLHIAKYSKDLIEMICAFVHMADATHDPKFAPHLLN